MHVFGPIALLTNGVTHMRPVGEMVSGGCKPVKLKVVAKFPEPQSRVVRFSLRNKNEQADRGYWDGRWAELRNYLSS